VVALPVQLVKILTIAFTAFDDCVDHVSARFLIDRITVIVLAHAEQRQQLLPSLYTSPVVNRIAGTAGHRQTIHDVSCHEWIALVVFPPTPTAVAMLIRIQPIETF